MSINKKEYKDIDLNFKPHPVSGDIQTLSGVDAIKRSVRNIVLHNFYERPFDSDFGSNTRASLFENMGPIEVYQLRENIASALRRSEPRIKLTNINIIENIDSNRLDVDIFFTIFNSLDSYNVTVFLKRVR